MAGGVGTIARPLHYVMKIGDRKAAIDVLVKQLKMKVLRHEEFEEGCKATCNGPYDGKWSKTMIGYGDEKQHFVLELTYNYGISKYRHGNDVHALHIGLSTGDTKSISLEGYPLSIKSLQGGKNSVFDQLVLNAENINKTQEFWTKVLAFPMTSNSNGFTIPFKHWGGSNDNSFALTFQSLPAGGKWDRGTAFGRVAFAVPTNRLSEVEKTVVDSGLGKVITPLVSLDTPGKATVSVVICTDPNGHEICFVGEEGFSELSRVDPKAEALLNESIEKDKSNEWFANKGKEKESLH